MPYIGAVIPQYSTLNVVMFRRSSHVQGQDHHNKLPPFQSMFFGSLCNTVQELHFLCLHVAPKLTFKSSGIIVSPQNRQEV